MYGTVRERHGPHIESGCPYGHFPTKDGKWVAIACTTDKMFARLADAMGRPELASSSLYGEQKTRLENRSDVNEIVRDWCGSLTPRRAAGALLRARCAGRAAQQHRRHLRRPAVPRAPQPRRLRCRRSGRDGHRPQRHSAPLRNSRPHRHLGPALGEHTDDGAERPARHDRRRAREPAREASDLRGAQGTLDRATMNFFRRTISLALALLISPIAGAQQQPLRPGTPPQIEPDFRGMRPRPGQRMTDGEVFRLLDIDRQGTISGSEWRERRMAIFYLLDNNNDIYLERSEMPGMSDYSFRCGRYRAGWPAVRLRVQPGELRAIRYSRSGSRRYGDVRGIREVPRGYRRPVMIGLAAEKQSRALQNDRCRQPGLRGMEAGCARFLAGRSLDMTVTEVISIVSRCRPRVM